MLIALGTLAWILSCVVVVSLCAMAARGDGRQMRQSSKPKAPRAPATTTHFVIR